MSDTQFDDLKQFIASIISQTEGRLRSEIVDLQQMMSDGFAGVGEAIEIIHQYSEKRDSEIDLRLTKLEQQAA